MPPTYTAEIVFTDGTSLRTQEFLSWDVNSNPGLIELDLHPEGRLLAPLRNIQTIDIQPTQEANQP